MRHKFNMSIRKALKESNLAMQPRELTKLNSKIYRFLHI